MNIRSLGEDMEMLTEAELTEVILRGKFEFDIDWDFKESQKPAYDDHHRKDIPIDCEADSPTNWGCTRPKGHKGFHERVTYKGDHSGRPGNKLAWNRAVARWK